VSCSVEAEVGNRNSDSPRKSNDRTSEDRKKRMKSSGVNTQEDTDANGELDSLAADELAANEETSSPAPPPKKKPSLKSRMEREAELLTPFRRSRERSMD
jgi:hypothetical protein